MPNQKGVQVSGGVDCNIAPVGKRRDGGTRYWCLEHRADATVKYGLQAKKCRYADIPPVQESNKFSLNVKDYLGGIALWGAVPPIYDTTTRPLDKGIHIHARREAGEAKDIDQTYQQVELVSEFGSWSINELDAIYYMASSVFGFDVKSVTCKWCGCEHLDKDWFSIHPHQSHLCSGCGKYFRDDCIAVGNPVSRIMKAPFSRKPQFCSSKKVAKLKQKDFIGGIQIWGSNPAILWTSRKFQETGVHIHAFSESSEMPVIDDTFSRVEIDGVVLDAEQVRTFMAQSSLPHLSSRVRLVICGSCGCRQFDRGHAAFAPVVARNCQSCGKRVNACGRLRRVVANPILEQLELLASFGVRSPQSHDAGLLSETL